MERGKKVDSDLSRTAEPLKITFVKALPVAGTVTVLETTEVSGSSIESYETTMSSS
jgi:hypothetical protein